jgi:TRAP transporter TAXI family solute receptor
MTRQAGLGRPWRAWGKALPLALLLGVTAEVAADPPLTFVTLGTSESLYYEIGRALCSVINKTRREHGIRCSAEPTPGSVYNLERLRDGDLDFALAQSDAHFAAYRGEGNWSGSPFTGLRSVMALYPELVTLLVRPDANIASLADLKGKRINVGNPGSGTRTTWDRLQMGLGWSAGDFGELRELSPGPAGEALCTGQIDASFLMVGHPSPIVEKEIQRCPQGFAPAGGPEVDRMLAELPYYIKGVIAKGLYGLPGDIQTYGAKATLVTTAAMPEPVVYTLVKTLMDNLKSLSALHPALATLRATSMATDTLSAPLHPGAERAFRELQILP